MALLFLSADERRSLRLVSRLSPAAAHRRSCSVVLWVASGYSVAGVARAYGLSRPTVYRYLGLWREFRDSSALHPRVATRLRPWRKRPAVGPVSASGTG